MPRINQSIESEVIDERTGEFISKRANRTLSWGDEPSYIKLYLQDVLYLADIPNKHEQVLYELLKRASYAGDQNGMEVIINAALKRRIAQTVGMKNVGSVSNAITDLVKGKILYRMDVGMYKFNPYLFGKGDWQDISRLRLEINYDDIRGKSFRANVEYKPPEAEQDQNGEVLAMTGTE